MTTAVAWMLVGPFLVLHLHHAEVWGQMDNGDSRWNGKMYVTHKQLDRALRECQQADAYADLVQLNDGYYLAFRATAGIGQPVYQAYMSHPHDDDIIRRTSMPCGCLSVDGARPCDRHYKSRILVFWDFMKIDMVRVSMYLLGKEVMFFEFNGTDSTSQSFFSADTMTDSSFTDTSGAVFNFFSIKGHERLPEVQRRFFVNRRYAGNCKKDEGWLVVLDSLDKCGYHQTGALPAFLGSSASTSQRWLSGQIVSGDVLVVAVKFKDKFNPNDFNLQCLL